MLRDFDMAASEVQSNSKPRSAAMSSSDKQSSSNFMESRALSSPSNGVSSETVIDLSSSKAAMALKILCFSSTLSDMASSFLRHSPEGSPNGTNLSIFPALLGNGTSELRYSRPVLTIMMQLELQRQITGRLRSRAPDQQLSETLINAFTRG